MDPQEDMTGGSNGAKGGLLAWIAGVLGTLATAAFVASAAFTVRTSVDINVIRTTLDFYARDMESMKTRLARLETENFEMRLQLQARRP